MLNGACQGEKLPSQGPSVGADGSARNATQLSQESPERLMQVPGHMGRVPLSGLSLLGMARAAVSLEAGSAGGDPRGERKLPSPVIQTSKPRSQPWKSGLGTNSSSCAAWRWGVGGRAPPASRGGGRGIALR